MDFNFNIKKTRVYRAVKIEKLFLFKFINIFRIVSLTLFIFSIFIFLFSFLGVTSEYYAIKICFLFLSLFLLFQNLFLFLNLKVKNPETPAELSQVQYSPKNYNIADFLDFKSAKIVIDSLKFCKKRNIPVHSSAVLYSALRVSNDIPLILFRLGINNKKFIENLKNYLEKKKKGEEKESKATDFSDDFKETIMEAINLAILRGSSQIGEKDILIGLAKRDDFFKKVLVEYDLKEEDIVNISLWLDSAERAFKKSKQFWSYDNLARQGSLGRDWAFGYTITLDRFGIDWRNAVKKWTVREIIGHKKEINEIEVILAKSSQTNVLIVGDPGTGRKSIVEAIAQRCYLGTSLPELRDKRVVELDLVSLVSTVQDFEKLEFILDQIFNEAIAAGNVILVIDELQNFVGLKENKPGQVDISGILAKYLPLPSFNFIAITDYLGLHKNIEEVPSLASLFRKVEVIEVNETETINILQSSALELEYKNKMFVLYPSIREIVNLTARYIPSLPFPKKALDILEEVVVYVSSKKEKIVMPHHVAEVISSKTEIPVGKMDLKEKETLLNLENLIHQHIVNQSEAVKEISISMRRARSGIGSKTRPMGTFLFLGPTGVGKTETAKALAKIYFGGSDKMIRIDMSEFQSVSDIPRLIGSVSPVEMQGLLTTPVRETPFSLVLLDEIEKAHPNILNLFLQVLDDGHITDGQGRKIVFNNTIIICTSNAGADIIFKKVGAGQGVKKDDLLPTLFDKNIFRPEFVNRFDATVIFNPLTKDNLLKISELLLQGLKNSLKEKNIDFQITENLKESIVTLSYKPEFGAREMRRVIQDKVENSVAEALLSEKLKKADSFTVNPETFELLINEPK